MGVPEDGPAAVETAEWIIAAIPPQELKQEVPVETHVEFRTDRFPPYDGEEGEVNPGRYGKRLAEFVATGLKARGFEPGEPVAEDWGWVVPIRNDGFRLWVGCGNYEEHDDGFLCFIEPHTPTVRSWLRKIDTTGRVGAVREALDRLLSEAGVRDKRWWTHDAFNRGGN